MKQEICVPTDSHGIGGERVSTEISQALVGITKLFRKLQQEESATEERMKAVHLILLYHKNASTACLPFSIGTVQPYYKNDTAVVHLDIPLKNGQTMAMVTAFYGGSKV